MKLNTFIAISALTAGSVFAQDQSSQNSSTASPSSPTQGGTLQQAETQEFFRASNIIGKTAQDSKAQKLGSIKDVVFNQQGEIFAFVDIGGGKWAAGPWQVVNPNSAKGKDNVVLNTTQQQLKSAPSVAKDQWGALNNPAFAQGIYSYYQVQAPTATGGASSPGSSSQGQSVTPPPSSDTTSGSSSSSTSPTPPPLPQSQPR